MALAIAVGFLGYLGWLHEHDARVRFEVQSAQQRKELAFNDKQIEGLRSSLEIVSNKYLMDVREYKRKRKIADVSVAAMSKKLEALAESIRVVVPDSSKTLVATFVRVCDAIKAVVTDELSQCEALRQRADSTISFQDTTIWRLGVSRDGYKRLYESQRGQQYRGGIWSTVGKVETGVGVLVIVGRILHLW